MQEQDSRTGGAPAPDGEFHADSNRTPGKISMETLEYPSADGLKLRGDAWGDPDDPPVLLLHGGGQTRHAWSGTAETIARDGWYAVSIDMRGHGESEWCPEGNYLHDDFASDTLSLARRFRTRPVIIGASLGGISALLSLGESASAPVARALVLVDIAVRMEAAGAQRIIEFMKSRPDGFGSLEEVADAVAAYNPHRPRPKDVSGLTRNLRLGEDGRYRWHWDPQFLEGPRRMTARPPFDPDALDRAARTLSIPTLLVRGRMSDLLSQEGADEFLETVPHAKFADVSEAGHMVAGDRNDLFTNAVLDFMRSDVSRD